MVDKECAGRAESHGFSYSIGFSLGFCCVYLTVLIVLLVCYIPLNIIIPITEYKNSILYFDVKMVYR